MGVVDKLNEDKKLEIIVSKWEFGRVPNSYRQKRYDVINLE